MAFSSELTAPDIENAAESARSAAEALLRGHRDGFNISEREWDEFGEFGEWHLVQ